MKASSCRLSGADLFPMSNVVMQGKTIFLQSAIFERVQWVGGTEANFDAHRIVCVLLVYKTIVQKKVRVLSVSVIVEYFVTAFEITHRVED